MTARRATYAVVEGRPSIVQGHMNAHTATSLIIPVYEAAFVQPFRVKHLQRPGVTMPPHITVQIPSIPPQALDTQLLTTLRALCASYGPFSLTFARTARFVDPGVLYLVPEPTDTLATLHHLLRSYAPADAPAHPVFHLTLAGWHPTTLDSIEQAFHAQYGEHLPLAARATELCLYLQRGTTWIHHARFPFATEQRGA